MKAWQVKAKRVIGALCLEAYKRANRKPNGGYYKKRRSYHVPEDAEYLLSCLNEDNEHAAKVFFVHGIKE